MCLFVDASLFGEFLSVLQGNLKGENPKRCLTWGIFGDCCSQDLVNRVFKRLGQSDWPLEQILRTFDRDGDGRLAQSPSSAFYMSFCFSCFLLPGTRSNHLELGLAPKSRSSPLSRPCRTTVWETTSKPAGSKTLLRLQNRPGGSGRAFQEAVACLLACLDCLACVVGPFIFKLPCQFLCAWSLDMPRAVDVWYFLVALRLASPDHHLIQ